MDANKKVYIELTEEQKNKLSGLFEEVAKATYYDKPIMLLSQIYQTNDGEVVAICNVLTHEESILLQKILSPDSVGEYVGHDYAVEALEKSRK